MTTSPSQEIAQALLDEFNLRDINNDGMLSFSEAHALLTGLTAVEFIALDQDGDNHISQSELIDAGAVEPPPASGGGGCNSLKRVSDLKDSFGDLFLLGLLSVVLLAWRGVGVRR